MDPIIENYLQTIKGICPKISDETLYLLGSKISIIKLPVKGIFIHAHLSQKNVGYVSSGLIRAFYVNPQGQDITINFIDENKLVVHLDALSQNKPSKFSFQALEPTVILNIPKEHIDFCSEKDPLIERYLRVMIEQVYCLMFNRLEGLLIENSKERYLSFVEDFPVLFNRIPISHLCTYLGINRQSLTRIRKKISLIK